MDNNFNQYWYGHPYDFEFETYHDYYNSINIWDFYGDSNSVFSMSKLGTRQITQAIANASFAGTYFEWLPNEIIDIIMDCVRVKNKKIELQFYQDYFSKENTEITIVRTLRMTPLQKRLISEGEIVPNIISVKTPDGEMCVRRILANNPGSQCYKTFSDMIQEFNNDKYVGLIMMYDAVKEWMIWICDHIYIPSWLRFMRIIIRKVYAFDKRIRAIENGDVSEHYNTPQRIANARVIIDNLIFFVEKYIPYALLSRSNEYYNVLDECMEEDTLKTALYEIWSCTGYHPNNINIQKAYEFEMMTYAKTYYCEIYSKYMTLRNGKVLTPLGKKPVFFWCGNEYIHQFI